jgi:aldehyde dehydrogenase (NAD+)
METTNKSYMLSLIKNQRDYFNSGQTRNTSFRQKQLRQLSKMLREHRNDFLLALKKDLSRHDFESCFAEIELVLQEIRFTSENLQNWVRPEYVQTPPLHQPGKSFIIKEPYGVVLIIAPWNYPLQLLLGPLVGSIAAGNCSILKPSEISQHTSSLLSRTIPRYFEPSFISVIEGGIAETQELLKTPFDYIFYTGSTAVGKVIMESAAKNLTPVTLELGGKSPCIVDKSNSLKRTAGRICFGKFFNAGQTCIAPDYVLVKEEYYEKLIQELQEIINKRYGPDPSKSNSYARIINEKHYQRLVDLMKDGKIVAGGIVKAESKYISPTIILEPNLSSPLMQEEIFGPILPIIPYKEIDDAITFINSRPKPLALYLFTKNKSVRKKIITQTSSGGICINDTLSHITTSGLPFGGVGFSGMGSYHGEKTFNTFTHEKSVMKKSLFPDPSLRYPPYLKPGKFIRFIIRLIS